MRKLLLSAVAGVAIALTALAGALAAPVPPASAASGAEFDPGYIISDGRFFDEGAMSAGQIQAFLDARVPNCRAGYTCLRQYSQATPYVAPDRYCGGHGGAPILSAASIIQSVAASCGINPQVLLVLLEKEQSLVTDTSPLASQYQKATGFSCPDTAPCDPQFGGFFYQVYYAARQFQVYTQNPGSWRYQAGKTVNIQWHPDLGRCGSAPVYIRNQATANLYIYTPYQPNAAALANLYGTGDTCSSYGNRNFWRIFYDWFGNPAGYEASFVNAVYADVLGRAPDPSGLATWTSVIRAGAPSYSVSDSILTSVEYRGNRIEAAYQGVLGRPSDPSGKQHWLAMTGGAGVAIDDVELFFLQSDEFFNNLGQSNPAYIREIYQRFLGRSAADSEVAFWEPLVVSQGRSSVLRGIWNSYESGVRRIEAMYSHFLGRGLDPSGRDTWTRVIISRGDNAVRISIVGSAEYWNRSIARYPNL